MPLDNPFADLIPGQGTGAPAVAPAPPAAQEAPQAAGFQPAAMVDNPFADLVPPPPGWAESAAGATAQGVAQVFGDIPKSAAITAEQGYRAQLEMLDRIDRGEPIPEQDMPMALPSLVKAYQAAGPDERKMLRDRLFSRPPADPMEAPLSKAGEALQQWTRETFPTDPAKEGFVLDVFRGLGTFAGMAATGAAGRAVGIGATLPGAATGAAMSQTDVFADALDKGASIEKAFEAANLGALVGMSEVVPVLRALDRFDKGSGGSIRNIIKETIKGGTEEAIQEGGAAILRNLIANSSSVAYDPERKTFEGIAYDSSVGFTVGGLVSFLAAALGGKRARTRDVADETVQPTAAPVPEAGPFADLIPQPQETAPRAEAEPVPERAVPKGAVPAETVLPATPEEAPAPRQPAPAEQAAPALPAVGERVTVEAEGMAPTTGTVAEVYDELRPGGATAPTVGLTTETGERVEVATDLPGFRVVPVQDAPASPSTPAPPVEAQAAPEPVSAPQALVAVPASVEARQPEVVHPAAPEPARTTRETIAATTEDVIPAAEKRLSRIEGYIRGTGSLAPAAVARATGYSEADVRRALDTVAARSRVIRKTATGYRRAPKFPADTLIQWIARTGGIQDPGGDLRAMDLHKRYVPGAGNVVRKRGRHPDYVREAAIELGYLPEDADINALYEALREDSHGRAVRTQEGQDHVREREEREQTREIRAAMREAEQETDAVAKEAGATLSADERTEIAERVAQGHDARDVFVEVVERRALTDEGELADQGSGIHAVDRSPEGEAGAPAPVEGEDAARPGRRAARASKAPRRRARRDQQARDAEEQASRPKRAELDPDEPPFQRPGIAGRRIGDGAFIYRTSPEYADRRAALRRRVERVLSKTVPGARFEVLDSIVTPEGVQALERGVSIEDVLRNPAGYAYGAQIHDGLGHLIGVALDSPNPLNTVRHETIHLLKRMGAITDGNWRVLERQTGKWRDRYNIEQRYDGLTEAQKVEEAIAEAYAEWAAGKLDNPGAVDRIFARIRAVLARIRFVVRQAFGKDADWRDVFVAVESGRLEGRRMLGGAETEPATDSSQPDQPTSTLAAQREGRQPPDLNVMPLGRSATYLARLVSAKKEGQGLAYGRENKRSRYYRLPNGGRLRISDHGALIGSLSRNVDVDVVLDERQATITRRSDGAEWDLWDGDFDTTEAWSTAVVRSLRAAVSGADEGSRLQRPNQPRDRTTDRTDQGEQRVLPGAERISDREQAERGMRGRKEATKPQKSAGDLPLFSDERKQGSLSRLSARVRIERVKREMEDAGGPVDGWEDLTQTDAGARLLNDLDAAASRAAAGTIGDDWVLRRGKAIGVEHLVALDADGLPVAVGRGDRRRINFPRYLLRAMERGVVAYATHNHPRNSGLSPADIVAMWYGDMEVAAFGHTGARLRARVSPAVSKSAVGGTPGKFGAFIGRIRALLKSEIQSAIRAEKLSADQATLAYDHLFSMVLHRHHVIDLVGNSHQFVTEAGVDAQSIFAATDKGVAEHVRRAGYPVSEVRDQGGDFSHRGEAGEDGPGSFPAGVPAGRFGARNGGRGLPASPEQLRLLDARGRASFQRPLNTDTAAFKRWFGKSKVVDEKGEPLVVYHGTTVDLTAFGKETVAKRFPFAFGFHFTDRPSEASIYAYSVENAAVGFDSTSPFAVPSVDGGNVVPVYIRSENPLVIDGTFEDQPASVEADLNRGEIISKLVKAQRDGRAYDGVIIRRKRGDEWDGMNVIVFEPEQIKSVFNRGTFDPADPRILFQRPPVKGTRRQEAAISRAIQPDTRGLIQKAADTAKNIRDKAATEWRMGIFDQFDPIRQLGFKVQGNVPTRELVAYVATRLSQHPAGQIEAFLRHGQPVWDQNEGIVTIRPGTRGLFEIVSLLYESGLYRLFEGYAYARRVDTQGLIAAGKERNLTDPDVAELMALETDHPEFRQIFDELQAYKTSFLDLAEDLGLVNAKQRAIWEQADHMPFYRIAEDEKITAPRSSKGLSGQSAKIRKLTGGPVAFHVIDMQTGESLGAFGEMSSASREARIRNRSASTPGRFQVERGGAPIPGIIENLARNIQHLMSASMKNHAAVLTLGDALQAGVAERIPPDMRPAPVPTGQIMERLELAGIDVSQLRRTALVNALTNASVTVPSNATIPQLRQLAIQRGIDPNALPMREVESLFTIVPPKDLEKNVVALKVNGETEYYRLFDPLLWRALTSLHETILPAPIRALGYPKRFFTRMITADPAFMARNFVRDSGSAWGLSDTRSLNFPLEMMRAVRKLPQGFSDSPSMLAIMAAGGDTGWYQNAPENVVKQLEKMGRRQRYGVLSLADPRVMLDALERFGRATEQANRLVIYEATQQKTGSKRQAAFEAADIMDFQMRGAWTATQWLIHVTPFLNARLQGLYRLGKAATGPHRKDFMLKGSLLAAMILPLALFNADDEEEGGYNDLPEWLKDSSYVIPIGRLLRWAEGNSGETWTEEQWMEWSERTHLPRYFLIPKPFEVGAIFGTIPERMIQVLYGNDDTKQVYSATKRLILETFAFNPVGNPFLMEPIEQFANRDTFRDRPIVKRGLEGLPPGLQHDAYTSDTARVIGEELDLSPERIEHAVRGVTGTIGSYLLSVSDVGVRAIEGKQLPQMRPDDYPLARSLMQFSPTKSTKWMEEFYEMKNEAEGVWSAYRRMHEEGRPTDAEKLLAKNKGMIEELKNIRGTAKALSGYRNTQQLLMIDEQLGAAAKRSLRADLSTIKGVPPEIVRKDRFTPADKRVIADAIAIERNRLVLETKAMKKRANP